MSTPSISSEPRVFGAGLTCVDSTALALVDVSGMTVGTRVFNQGAALPFELRVSTAPLSSTVVAVSGVTGMRWLAVESEANPTWVAAGGGDFGISTTASDEAQVPVLLETFAPADDVELLRVSAPGTDTSTGEDQDGPGCAANLLGGVVDLENPNICDAGDHEYAQFLVTAQKLIPTVLGSNYLYINTTGTPDPITRLVGVLIPHVPVNTIEDGVLGEGDVEIGEVIGLWMDGSADLNGGATCTGRMLSIRTGHAIASDLGLYVGKTGDTHGGFVDFDDGTDAGSGAVGHGRIVYLPETGFVQANEAAVNFQPLAGTYQIFKFLDPDAQVYAAGITVLQHIVPTDTGPNLQTMTPLRWTLPPQISITGGVLKGGIRFNLSSGSQPIIYNTEPSPVDTNRGDVYTGITGAYIQSIDFIINNTSPDPSGSENVGAFALEGTCS